MNERHVYIAGPMRGYPKFNFDAFEAAAVDLESKGLTVISPHRMDLEIGFNPCVDELPADFDVADCIRRDVEAVIATEACVFLAGWEKSVGANAEKLIAEWLGRPCYSYPDFQPLRQTITHGNTK